MEHILNKKGMHLRFLKNQS